MECGRDRGVRDVAANILEAEGGEGDKADFAFQLYVVELCGTTLESNVESTEEGARARTVLGERAGVAAGPLLVLREAIIQENLEQREELVVLCGDDSVKAEEGVEIEVSGKAEGGCDGIDGCTLGFW